VVQSVEVRLTLAKVHASKVVHDGIRDAVLVDRFIAQLPILASRSPVVHLGADTVNLRGHCYRYLRRTVDGPTRF